MFCYQRSFGLPTEVVTEERFWALVRAPKTSELIDGYRATGDAELKRKLPAFIFQATFEETVSKKGNKGAWRCQAGSRLNGLCVMDIDHVESPQEVHGEWLKVHGDLKALGVLLIYITPSGKGLKIVFKADAEKGNLIDNQHAIAKVLGVVVDESCKDASRMSFICKESDILFLDNELFTYENPDFGKKYNEAYRAGNSQPTLKVDSGECKVESQLKVDSAADGGDTLNSELATAPKLSTLNSKLEYHGVPYAKIVEAWIGEKKVEAGDRHRTSLILADHLRYITDNDPKLIEQILRETPFVKQIIEERNEDVCATVKSAQGYEFLKGVPRRMQNALKIVGASPNPSQGGENGSASTSSPLGRSGEAADVYDVLPLDSWSEELQEMAEHYPCMKELFVNVHPHKLPAVWFSSAALFGTLMTRAYYHFWYEPEIIRRLNYCIFIIGDPGAGKNIVEKFYKKIADPMIQSDKCLIDAVNRYKEGRTERSTSTKAQKDEALKRPVVGIRVHPARTATGEFIRHMNAAIETVEGQPLNLHMFSFDAELDNVTKQNKGGDWKDREIMELKAFHNEEEGQMYANQESYTGMFNIYWNFIYTGTPYALHRKVNQRNFGTGMSTRLAVIPLPDRGLAKRNQVVDPNANETLKTWAYRLDKVEGEIPIEPLNDETYEWQSSRLEIAEFNGDKADRTLLKRIPYYGIGISLPFILMRHWEEWQEKKTLTMDDRDKRLCRLAMEIQYKCQQFFFGEMAYNYFADQNKEFVQRRRTTRYDECFRKLPDEFKTQQFKDCFNTNDSATSRALKRLKADGLIEKLSYGAYRKLVQELP